MTKIAAIVTEYRYLSHAQVICDRLLMGYSVSGQFRQPSSKIVSMFVDQFPENDLSRDRAERFGFTIYPTIAAALRDGGSVLGVDGVLIIGEHGNYPRNEKDQILYPRHEFFRQTVDVFKRDGKGVPVFVDKHLSFRFDNAAWTVREARRLGFALMAGSSVPVAWRLPPLELPLGCDVADALAVGYGGVDSYDFHALEGLQCMVERRRGGETGVAAIEYLEGDDVWDAGDAGVWSYELLESALSRSDTIRGGSVEDGRPENVVKLGKLRGLVEKPAAYVVEYRDGLRATMLMLNGAVNEFLFAARLKGERKPVATQFFLTPIPNVNHFSGLVAKVEEMFVTGRAPYPAERTLLVSGVLEACLTARFERTRRRETPDLSVSYAPSPESHFLRD
jgi:hypothetical protein